MKAILTLAKKFLAGALPARLPDFIFLLSAICTAFVFPRGALAQTAQLDFGDAPQNYPVLLGNDGARHTPGALRLGPNIDAESNGQPSGNATADDVTPAGTPDDEDGVQFLTAPLVPGQSASVRVTASMGDGLLNAWIDFNRNGTWNDLGEKIFSNLLLTPGVNTLTFSVPTSAAAGDTFARFRLSFQSGLLPTGAAQSGEVEDYMVTVQGNTEDLDFGDAPISQTGAPGYPVTLGANGARHRQLKGFFLGSVDVDIEKDGQPSTGAVGDDTNGIDDEDGVKFPSPLIPGKLASIEVTASSSDGKLDAWIDFNGNGSWADAGEKICSARVLGTGLNIVTFDVPPDAKIGQTYSRFRYSIRGGLDFFGGPIEGEVEDHALRIEQDNQDYGDAPEIYPTLLSQDGARHILVQGFNLGNLIDTEANGQPSALADGDDNNPSATADDEDGVRFTTAVQVGEPAQVEVTLKSGTGRLDAWIDFNADGDWADAGEQIFTSQALVAGANLLNFNVPSTAVARATFSRFRLSRQGGLKFTGLASDGEVEDHRVTIIEPRQPCVSRTNMGIDFWLTFPGNYAPDPDNPVKISLCIVGQRETTGKVEIPGLGFSKDFFIGGTMEVTIDLPREAELGNSNDEIGKNGIHVTANKEVAVFGMNRVRYTTDGYLGLPSDVIGRRYIIQGFGNEFEDIPDLNGTQFAIVATQDQTKVAIVPSVDTLGHPAGVPYSMVLNQGETYQLRNPKDFDNDLVGTIVVSDKPISVLGSHQCANIPNSAEFFCDYIVEQLLPIDRGGVNFFTAPLATRTTGDTYRFLAIEDDTTVSVNGVAVTTLNSRKYHERQISGGAHITANKPILVTQYANSADWDGVIKSDPFMIVIPPVNMFRNQYIVCTPHANFPDNWLSVVAPNGVVGGVNLDGVPIPAAQYTAIGATGYSYARVKVAPGAHTMAANLPFGVTLYGWDTYDSYGFPGGMLFGDSVPPHLSCPDKVTVVLTSAGTTVPPCAVPVPDFRQQVKVTDDCGLPDRVVINQDPKPGTLVGPGVHVVTLTAADAQGNIGQCETIFEVIDPSPITLVCPEDMFVSCNQPGGAIVTFEVTAQQRCGNANLQVTCQPESGSFFPEGETVVVCSALGPDGKSYTCSFKVIVRCARPTIGLAQQQGNTFTLNWSGNAVLEHAPTIMGPWTVVEGAQGAYTVIPKDQRGFFRLRLVDR